MTNQETVRNTNYITSAASEHEGAYYLILDFSQSGSAYIEWIEGNRYSPPSEVWYLLEPRAFAICPRDEVGFAHPQALARITDEADPEFEALFKSARKAWDDHPNMAIPAYPGPLALLPELETMEDYILTRGVRGISVTATLELFAALDAIWHYLAYLPGTPADAGAWDAQEWFRIGENDPDDLFASYGLHKEFGTDKVAWANLTLSYSRNTRNWAIVEATNRLVLQADRDWVKLDWDQACACIWSLFQAWIRNFDAEQWRADLKIGGERETFTWSQQLPRYARF